MSYDFMVARTVANQEKAFTPFFFRQLFHRSITNLQLTIANLAILGFFFAMRSCKYVQVTKGERKTKLITLGNIEFWGMNKKKLKPKNPKIFKAQAVLVTFEDQKN